ncbi:ATP-binding protein involved in chromosome partitioning [Palleronia aestuarii]|uniref:Iron-sulfur cluster carrier protein n=1 Tax=Palleronia aestuarii TaxID=568105 RepID=A0A2W7QBJ6_9RHOB|nr:Mrp/NBP35 family ATP-binding protein [Palleronia aestuarii]PZX19119.1 ATP-binding protein involved in chromosome partitioning [Palleronia aestuarii]
MSITREDILADLRTLKDPATGQDIVSAGIVRALTIDGAAVRFVMEIAPEAARSYEPVRSEAEAIVGARPGVETVSAVLTAHQKPQAPPDLKPARRAAPSGPEPIPGVDRLVAIASGKGGVGKSTLSSNLACALAAEGRRVGLLDADVYGPSQPRMLGVTGRPASPDGKTILPMRSFDVTMMSIGLMVNEGQAVIWRGPMLMGALQQMLMQVRWGELDILLVDLPPGTGDVSMTLAQKARLDGAIIVSTPQDVALLDARKSIDMFKQLKTPIYGMVENMSTHICSNCGHEEHVFGHGGVARECETLGVPLLAEIPLHLDIRTASDAGRPIVAADPEGAQARSYRDLSRRLIEAGQA